MAMEDVEWQWQSLPLLFSGAAAPASAPSVSTALSAVDPSIWVLLEVQYASIHLIAAIFVEAASLIDRSTPSLLFQFLPCFVSIVFLHCHSVLVAGQSAKHIRHS